MERIKKYFRTFLAMGIGGGFLFGLAMSFKVGCLEGIILGAEFGSLGSILMAIYLIPLDYFMTRKIPDNALNVKQEREVRIEGSMDDAFKKCVYLLEEVKAIKSVSPSREDLEICARGKASLLSIGQKITLQFREIASGFIIIKVRSAPINPFLMLDYGTNFRKVEMICKEIERTFPLHG